MRYRLIILSMSLSLMVTFVAEATPVNLKNQSQADQRIESGLLFNPEAPTPYVQGGLTSEKLASVNGQTITLANLEPVVREAVDKFEKQMPDLRKDALEARINTLLLDSEAEKRKLTVAQLMDAEINSAIKDPTEAEIKSVYDANRQQIGSADLASVRSEIISYLRNQTAQKLSDDLVKRLRQTHSLVMGMVSVNAPNLKAGDVLATIDGKALTAGDFTERLKPFVYKLQHEIYEGEMRAVDLKINQMLLEAESRKLNKTPEDIYKIE